MDRQPSPITIPTNRPTLRFQLPEGEREWQYDIVTLKIKIQELESMNKSGEPSLDDLRQFSEYLQALDIPAVNTDIALRIWSLVKVQFAKLAHSIKTEAQQVCQLNSR